MPEKNALYVEDEPALIRSMTIFIKEAGYDVLHTDNLEDATAYVKDRKFNLYVVDGTFCRSKSDRSLVRGAALELYDIMENHADNFVVVSGDFNLERECKARGIRFLLKADLDANKFIEYIKSIGS
ncbi:MAG: hypothetical protein NT120_01965 [Candidatus Aenigmarchaeota archaeon]|nr:hypothetical protein [Candidatus Aenigmarchaeota archaeon]